MLTLEELLDLIPKYLTAQLNDTERIEFESGLRKHPILRRETDEMRELQSGLAIADKYDEEHFDVDRLIVLAFNPDSLPETDKNQLYSHLDSCTHCHEMFVLARASQQQVSKERFSILRSLKRLLVPPEFVLRPAVAYGVLAICLIPAILFFSNFQGNGGGIQVIKLHESAERGASAQNSFSVVEGKTDILRLQFLLPTRTDCLYDILLLDENNKSVLSWPQSLPKSPFILDVPSSNISEGMYRLAIDERDRTGNQIEHFDIEFTIQTED